jgi:hypothetical protein
MLDRSTRSMVVLLFILLTSCGGGGTSPRDYVRAVCQATSDWQNDIEKEAISLAGSLSGNAGPAEQKEALVGLLQQLTTVTDRFAGRVESAGTPDIEGGEEAAESLRRSLDELNDAFRDARGQAEDLPTDSQEAFEAAAAKVGETINSSVDVLADPFGDQAEQLASVAESEPACKSLQG